MGAPMLLFQGVDPGTYSDYYLEQDSTGNHRTTNKRVKEGRLAFNGDGPRCVNACFEDMSGERGPGTYDYYHMYGTGAPAGPGGRGVVAHKGTNAFTNKVPLCGYIRKIDTPGVGAYSPGLDPRIQRGEAL